MSKDIHNLKCVECKAQCCRYLAMEIDLPTCKRDYDHVRWYLKHKDVHVFIDHDEGWYLEFETPCEALDENHLCGSYGHRPKICREHGKEDWSDECEFHAENEPHVVRFSTAEEFEAYLDDRKVDWRFKG